MVEPSSRSPSVLNNAIATLARVGEAAAHGTSAGWYSGCRCTLCRQAYNDSKRALGRARAQKRLPPELRQQLLDGIYAGQPFGSVVRELGLTPNQVWGLAQTDAEWSVALEEALTATRRDDLEHGTNAADVAGCVCKECRDHQRRRMARNRA
jgi:hypothetical protein